jgi:diadenosine tetraphosphate (Ap4A) HIT family hydrolase
MILRLKSHRFQFRNMSTLFEKIALKQIPSSPIYETETVYCFKDIQPTAPIHYILIPKKCDGLSSLSKAEDRHGEILSELMLAVPKIAKMTPELQDGFRIVINDGENGCQSVNHLHLHIIGGKKLSWPPGTGIPEGSMKG